jgi:prepilin signal peptidase PulO-like enzyme (type II secretory pathway)
MGEVLRIVLTLYLGIVGLLIGSFINLARDRLPRGESIVRPRSHCRSCGRQLDTVDLLPVVGYFVRGGKCATCRTPIGISAPFVELISGATMALPAVGLGPGWGALVGLAGAAVWGGLVIAIHWRQNPTS